jgi:hypothetical protein
MAAFTQLIAPVRKARAKAALRTAARPPCPISSRVKIGEIKAKDKNIFAGGAEVHTDG